MTDGRKPQTLLIPDHVWQAFEQMAGEMGNDRDGLINQALFTFARQHGYLASGVSSRPPPPPLPTPAPVSATKVLVLLSDGREVDRVVKERFVIGRGKHCDLVISSGKVSREHAAITREGNDYFIEDLGSSNGTWFDKRRISRRRIEEGDEYFISAERLACAFR